MPWELYRRHMGVVVQLDKNGNVKGVSSSQRMEDAKVQIHKYNH